MSRNGSGTYTLPAGNPVVSGTVIATSWANNTMNDLAAAMTDSVAADGQTPMTGPLNLNSNKIVNLANGTVNTDAVNLSQLVAATSGAVTITGGTINNTSVGATTASTGRFTTLVATGTLQATGVATFSAGTVSLPAITTTGDTNTGIYFPAADTIAFTEGGVEAMRIDASGNVGIGSTSVTNRLEVVQSDSADAATAIRAATNGFAANLKLIANDISGSRFNTINSLYGSTEQWSIKSGATDSTITFCTGSSSTERGRFDSSGNFLFNSGYGSVATAYGCRAWVNFDGTGTPAIRGSGNVSSITDNGTGDYTINFTTAMPDANYSVVGTSSMRTGDGALGLVMISTATAYTDSLIRIKTFNGAGVAEDFPTVNLSVFR
jgi:hypothetical protein